MVGNVSGCLSNQGQIPQCGIVNNLGGDNQLQIKAGGMIQNPVTEVNHIVH